MTRLIKANGAEQPLASLYLSSAADLTKFSKPPIKVFGEATFSARNFTPNARRQSSPRGQFQCFCAALNHDFEILHVPSTMSSTSDAETILSSPTSTESTAEHLEYYSARIIDCIRRRDWANQDWIDYVGENVQVYAPASFLELQGEPSTVGREAYVQSYRAFTVSHALQFENSSLRSTSRTILHETPLAALVPRTLYAHLQLGTVSRIRLLPSQYHCRCRRTRRQCERLGYNECHWTSTYRT